jgi:hypothetical protein
MSVLGEFSYSPQNIMCDDQVSWLRKILQSLANRVPKIVLQRAEDIFPAVRESMVSVLCLCAQKRVLLSSSVNFHDQIK